MKNPFRMILLALATVLPVLIFVACTSDQPVETIGPDGTIYDAEEYESMKQSGLVDEDGNIIDTSATSKKKSSSSNAAGSSSSGTSSSVTDSTKVSSSSQEGESSSSSEAVAESSSSEDVVESSSSEVVSSSSYEAVFGSGTRGESIIAKDGVLSIGTDAMSEVGEDDAEDLAVVKSVVAGEGETLPEGYSDYGLEKTTEEFNYEVLIETQVFCLTKEDSWLEVSRTKLGENIVHFKNGADLGPLESFKVSFADACSAVYAKN